ncbi:hypothetical protein [Glutamicibacter sp. JC586]|uniref:hypothetical protein n=1 Tax=Glutamicibacter sp. JC586 TaxID=2590552 RepID=UPI00135C0272|nr:hypothetical protein [Glutamicibacter sp. JC586]
MTFSIRPQAASFALIAATAIAMAGCAATGSPAGKSPADEVKTSATATPKASTAPEFGTAEATEEAVAHAMKYARASHTNGYYLSGQWVKDGASIDEMINFLGKYYSADELKPVASWKGKDLENEEFADLTVPLIMFWDETDFYKPYEKCTEQNSKACILSLKQGKATSKVDKSRKIVNVHFTQTSEFPLWSNEIDATVKATGKWSYDLDLAQNKDGGWEIVDQDIDAAFDALEPVTL